MKRFMRLKPSPSMVVAITALVVAGSGAAVAAIPNPDGSVDVCYQDKFKKLRFVRVIDTGDGESCHSFESALSVATTSGGKVADSDKLDGLDSTDFLGAGTAAGGDLTGNYPNPDIANGAVGAAEVDDGSLGTGEFSDSIPAVRVRHTADQSVADGGNLALAFDTELYDTASMHDPSTNTSRLVAPVTGIYEVSASITWASAAGGPRHLAVRKNGSTDLSRQGVASAPDAMSQSVSTSARLVAGDYVEAVAHQGSGGSLNVANQGEPSPAFSMAWLAPGP